MATIAATQSRSYDIWLWLGLGVTSFVTARIIARQLCEIVHLNEIPIQDDDDGDDLPPPTPTPPTTVTAIEEEVLSNEQIQFQESEEQQRQQRSLNFEHRNSSASARAGNGRRGREKQRLQPEDRIPIDVLSELAFCSSYDIREATNKIIAERWAKSERCKEALFTDLKSESALRREDGEHLLDTLRDYNVDPAPPAPPLDERSMMADGTTSSEIDMDSNLQTLEEVLEHALMSSFSIGNNNGNNNDNDNTSTTITTVAPDTTETRTTVVTDLAALSSRIFSSHHSSEIEDQEGIHEQERQRDSHYTRPVSNDGNISDEDDVNNSIAEVAQTQPQPRPSHNQSAEEAERRRGRREAVVYGVESANGEAEMLRVVRPGADPMEVHLRSLASRRGGPRRRRRRSNVDNDDAGGAEDD